MFENVNFYAVTIPFTLFGVIVLNMLKGKIDKIVDPQIRALKTLQLYLVFCGAIFAVMYALLPAIPTLSTFGYPDEVKEIQNPERLLSYLQEYNKAIVRTTEVVSFTLLWLVVLLAAAYSVSSTAIRNIQGLNNHHSSSRDPVKQLESSPSPRV